MIVELVGLPGSGKTVLARELRDRHLGLPSEACCGGGLPGPAQVVGRWGRTLRALTRHAAFARVLVDTARDRPRSARARLLAVRFALASLRQIDHHRRRHDDDVLVVEEGPLQRAFMLLVDPQEVDPSRVATYAAAAPAADLVVRLDVPVVTCIRDAQARDRPLPRGIGDLAEDEAYALLTSADALLDQAIEAQAEVDRPPVVLRIDPRRPGAGAEVAAAVAALRS